MKYIMYIYFIILQVSIAAMTCFHTIVQPYANTTSSALTSETLWEKVWDTWRHIGSEAVHNKLPAAKDIREFVREPRTHDAIDAFFEGLPSQTFLVHLLQIFPDLRVRLKGSHFSRQHFASAAQVFQSALLTPVSKDVSPFLVPMGSDMSMSSVQRLVLRCLASLVTDEVVLEQTPQLEARGGINSTNSIIDQSKITDMNRHISLSSTPTVYAHVLGELFLYSSYGWSPPRHIQVILEKESMNKLPLVCVEFLTFSLSSLTLSVQLIRSSLLSGDGQVTPLIIHKFIKVRRGNIPSPILNKT